MTPVPRQLKGSDREEYVARWFDEWGPWCCWCGRQLMDPREHRGLTTEERQRLVTAGNWPTVDHLQARVNGGRAHEDNLAVACQPCNNAKGERDPARFAVVALMIAHALQRRTEERLERGRRYINRLKGELEALGFPTTDSPGFGARPHEGGVVLRSCGCGLLHLVGTTYIHSRSPADELELVELGRRVQASFAVENYGRQEKRQRRICGRAHKAAARAAHRAHE